MTNYGWENAAAHFYASRELAHRLKSITADERGLHDEARGSGGSLLCSMIDQPGVVNDLLPSMEAEASLVWHCSVCFGDKSDREERRYRCGAAVAGAVAAMTWWGNVLLGLHSKAIPDELVPCYPNIVARVAAFEEAQLHILRLCIAAADGTAMKLAMQTGQTEFWHPEISVNDLQKYM